MNPVKRILGVQKDKKSKNLLLGPQPLKEYTDFNVVDAETNPNVTDKSKMLMGDDNKEREIDILRKI